MSVFSGKLTVYGQKWTVANRETITAEDVKTLQSYDVVDTEYGRSVLMIFKSGGYCYAKISTEGHMPEANEKIELVGKTLLTLTRPGEKPCYKIEL